MKNIYRLGFMLLLVAGVVSCEEDKVIYDVNGGVESYQFADATSDLPLLPGGVVSTATVEVQVTTKSDAVRTFPVLIGAESTATAAQYSIDAASLVIPAGSFIGEIKITGNFDAVPDGATETLVLMLDETAGLKVMDGNNTHVVNIFRSCPTDLAGNYSVTTTYGYHDFLPDYDVNTMNVAVTAVSGQLNTYKVADFSGGLYSVGPYADNYGTGAASAAAKRDLTFLVSCGAISWANEVDPWGAINPTDGEVNALDDATGSFTISWTCVGYGENGVSVYTPID
ncbi:MAG: hypothetical protein PSV16_14465 [Flavobacterium sp.]|nr:hypothetical protein [Flavobacterium sp.]